MQLPVQLTLLQIHNSSKMLQNPLWMFFQNGHFPKNIVFFHFEHLKVQIFSTPLVVMLRLQNEFHRLFSVLLFLKVWKKVFLSEQSYIRRHNQVECRKMHICASNSREQDMLLSRNRHSRFCALDLNHHKHEDKLKNLYPDNLAWCSL